MPMNLPESLENDGATVKYHDYTDTKNSCSIAVAFVASKLFFLPNRSCFFSATVHLIQPDRHKTVRKKTVRK